MEAWGEGRMLGSDFYFNKRKLKEDLSFTPLQYSLTFDMRGYAERRWVN
jgi:hypothetical protein